MPANHSITNVLSPNLSLVHIHSDFGIVLFVGVIIKLQEHLHKYVSLSVFKISEIQNFRNFLNGTKIIMHACVYTSQYMYW